MPAIIGQQDNSLANTAAAFLNIPFQQQKLKKAREQDAIKQQQLLLQQRQAESNISRNQALAQKAQQETSFGQSRQDAFNSPDLGSAFNTVINNQPGVDVGDSIAALFRASPGNTNAAQSGDFLNGLSQLFTRNQVAGQQNAQDPTGQANLAALAADESLPEPFRGNANGIVTNQLTGAQQAPNESVQQALIAQDAGGGGGNGRIIGQSLINNLLKTPAINEFGDAVLDLNGNPVTQLDNDRIADFANFAIQPENQGIGTTELVARYTSRDPAHQQPQVDPQPVQGLAQQAGTAEADLPGFFSQLADAFLSTGADAQAAQPQAQPVQLGPDDEAIFLQLPSGTPYIGPDGVPRVKP